MLKQILTFFFFIGYCCIKGTVDRPGSDGRVGGDFFRICIRITSGVSPAWAIQNGGPYSRTRPSAQAN